ncbi:MAG TPA: hypothetical protein VKZ85_03305 [Woeseiaceae bacterium]|nr:hypothetical protein [Woeseiaceae bacterium]
MRFTAEEIAQAAFDRAPEFRTRAIDSDVIARAFNQALKALVFEICDTEPERLTQTYTIEPEVVALDPVDLTAEVVDGQVVSGRREWLLIYSIDWLGANGDGDEVWIPEFGSRHRAPVDYEGHIVALAIDQQRKLRKVGDWSGVHTLELHGILAPQRVTARTLGGAGAPVFDYPAVLEEALICTLVMLLAPNVDVDRNRRQEWELDFQRAMDRLEADAASFIASTIRAAEVHFEV